MLLFGKHNKPKKCIGKITIAKNSKIFGVMYYRISDFVKEKTDKELLEHYFFVIDNHLTNLGILWIGKREHRARLLYAPSIQFIKYDELEQKVNKQLWDDFYLNPKEQIQAIWTQVADFKEGIEFPDGIFRKKIANYDEVVVRELLANAIVHRPYTIRGDIFINLYIDRLEVHNPGLLPVGVSPQNILHRSVQRNAHLAKVFYDLKLMEKGCITNSQKFSENSYLSAKIFLCA
jgi:ATP-dependent DNA helicase RecG